MLIGFAALCGSAVAATREPRIPPGRRSAPFVAPATSATSTTTAIYVNGTASGLAFDGVGAISGGGGNSRYLVDYPEPQRSTILDYLFKPGYGASLQVLKVEIGGDGNSTDGSEASSEHTQGTVDCGAGYEWWLMEQARARNPTIKLYGLAWTAPGWVGSFWSQATIDYVVQWLTCARQHGLTIDYVGGNQNEAAYVKTWAESLRTALDAAGFSRTRIAMADDYDAQGAWPIATDVASDPALSGATAVLTEHDVCGYPTNGNQCLSTSTARSVGKPLWASELGAMDGNTGAASMARSEIRGYSNAGLVSFITWPMVAAIPPGLPQETSGLIYANQPWSGYYTVNAMTYAIAMMSWFTAPGWHYVNGADGGLGGVYANGSYATLKAPNGTDWSTIAETTTTTAEQYANFTVAGGLAASTIHVWRTNLNSTNSADWMLQRSDIHPVGGKFSFGLLPGYVYTFTTVARSPKGWSTPPPPATLSSYTDTPDANPLDESPIYLAPMDGAFEHRPCADDPTSTCTQQMTPQPPVPWVAHAGFPYAVLGDPAWRDYTVSADVLFTHTGSSAGVLDRFSYQDFVVSNFRGYILKLGDDGSWQLLKNSRYIGVGILAAGALSAPAGVGKWHHLSLTISGASLTVAIDGIQVASVTDNDPNYTAGIAGIEAGAVDANGAWTGTSWPIVQYRHLTITP
jgi:Glycosyl hydrolase family 59/Concanavalin A-like lectin/glucanases superfamily